MVFIMRTFNYFNAIQISNILEYINKNHSLCRFDTTALLHSALSIKYPIPAPSFLSSFLTFNKQYTRELIAAPLGLNVPFVVIKYGMDEIQAGKILEELPAGERIIIKPHFGHSGRDMEVVASRGDVPVTKLLSSAASMKKTADYHFIDRLASEYLPARQCSTEPGYILEVYVDKDPAIATFHGVDCLVYGGKYIPWCIRDHIFWSKRRECHVGNAFPTSLSPEVQTQVWEVAAAVAKRMAEFGFDYQFFEVELIVSRTGKIVLMEINGRMPLTLTSRAYMEILENGDPVAAFMAMADGRTIQAPALKKGRHGIFAYLSMFGKAKVCSIFI